MPESESKPEPKVPLDVDKEPIVTQHRLGSLEYTATVGMLPIKDDFGEAKAGIFFVAYTKVGAEAGKRPLMFSFNGGPGSSSVWLHLGAVGPKRVMLGPDGQLPKPPYELADNELSWLIDTDLVFIDPVGTGFSRVADKAEAKEYWGLKGDVESIAKFISLYLSRYQRWASPLYMVGESYGTTRAAGLAGHLVQHGVAFSGIVLVSSILNFQTARFHKGNDLPYPLFFPTYTATAWYHKKLPKDLQRSFSKAIAEAQAFAQEQYPAILGQGDRLSARDRAAAVTKIARLTGLSAEYVDQTNLRINIHRFCKELLRTQKRTVGRLDSRYTGIDQIAVGDTPDVDPSMTALLPPYTSMINDYIRRDLGWETDMPYYVFNPGELWKNWDWGSAGEGSPDTSEALRSAMTRNPHMKVFIASGYFDLATPFFATEYTLAHLDLDSSLRKNITTKFYEAGHMMYIHEPSLNKLRQDISAFMQGENK